MSTATLTVPAATTRHTPKTEQDKQTDNHNSRTFTQPTNEWPATQQGCGGPTSKPTSRQLIKTNCKPRDKKNILANNPTNHLTSKQPEGQVTADNTTNSTNTSHQRPAYCQHHLSKQSHFTKQPNMHPRKTAHTHHQRKREQTPKHLLTASRNYLLLGMHKVWLLHHWPPCRSSPSACKAPKALPNNTSEHSNSTQGQPACASSCLHNLCMAIYHQK